MSEAASFRAVVELWASREAMAADISAAAGGAECKASAVSKWWQRDNIPAEWWAALLATSTAQVAGLTSHRLTMLAARSPSGAPEPVLDEARA